GTVLVGGEGAGFIQRVVSGERVGATVRYATPPASLAEVIVNDSFAVHLELPEANGSFNSKVRGVIPGNLPHFAPSGAYITGIGKTYTVQDLPLYGTAANGAVIKSAT